MGYYTNFELETVPHDQDAIDAVKARSGYDGWSGESLYEAKWYEHESHLQEVSRKFPLTIFKLHGEGEESGDLFDCYAFNGKVENCVGVVTYPVPDWLGDAQKAVKLTEIEREERQTLARLQAKYGEK